MFFLWVKIIKTKNINSNFESFTCEDRSEVSIDITNSLIELIISTVKEANIEDTDEYRYINEIINQENINKIKDCNDKAPSIPK